MSEITAYILGAGGHAKVLHEALQCDSSVKVAGFLDINKDLVGGTLCDLPINHEEILLDLNLEKVLLINGIGSIGYSSVRIKQFDRYKEFGYCFHTIKHPTSYIADQVMVGEGAQLMARSTIMVGTVIGDNAIINTAASIDHDCNIGKHTHIAPGVVLSGGVTVGENTHVGTGAKIIQGVQVGKNVLIAAGAVVVSDVPDNVRVAGVPARKME